MASSARLRGKLAQVPGAICSCRRCRTSASADAQQRAIPIHAQGDNANELYTWTPKLIDALQKERGDLPTSTPTSSRAAWRPTSMIDRDTASRLGLTAARSTTRSTTPSASGRSRPSTAPSTSITSSWRWRRATGRTRDARRTSMSAPSGGNASGTSPDQSAGRHGDRATATARPPRRIGASDSARNAATNAAGQHRQRQRLGRRRRQHGEGDDGAAGRLHALCARQDAARRSTTRACSSPATISFNLRPARRSSDGHRRDRRGEAADRHAGRHSRQCSQGTAHSLPGNRSPTSRC